MFSSVCQSRDFLEAPDVIGDSRFHRRRHAQGFVNTSKIVIEEMQRDHDGALGVPEVFERTPPAPLQRLRLPASTAESEAQPMVMQRAPARTMKALNDSLQANLSTSGQVNHFGQVGTLRLHRRRHQVR